MRIYISAISTGLLLVVLVASLTGISSYISQPSATTTEQEGLFALNKKNPKAAHRGSGRRDQVS